MDSRLHTSGKRVSAEQEFMCKHAAERGDAFEGTYKHRTAITQGLSVVMWEADGGGVAFHIDFFCPFQKGTPVM